MSYQQKPYHTMSRAKVLCLWDPSVGDGFLGRLPQVADVEVHQPSRDLLMSRIHEFDAYLASLHVRIDRPIIERAMRLRIVATPSTGLDHLDLDALAERKIQLISIKTEFELLDRVTATAEMTWCLLLACVRKLPAAASAAASGQWARDRFRGHQLSGKTLGILGVGRLGKMVASYANAFRMRVLGCDIRKFAMPGVEPVDLSTLLRQSDVITIHIHLTEENRHFIAKRELDQMKSGVVIVNTSRGAIIDETELLTALQGGKVAAAGLDVIDGEWRTDLAEHPLIRYARTHDNLIISPHLGGSTYESQLMTMAFTANKLADALEEI